MQPPILCPVHLSARRLCTYRCAEKRRVYKQIQAGFRQYWYDRRRGVRAFTTAEYRIRYGWPPRV